MDKICLVLVGPIAGNDRIYHDGEEIILKESTAVMFAGWGFVEILGDAVGGAVAGKADPSGGLAGEEATIRKRKAVAVE